MNTPQGIVAAAITPRSRQGDADLGAALELVGFLCESGAAGIALLGATGEFAGLSSGEHSRLAYLAAKRSRVPLLVGVGSPSLDGAVELAREAAGSGAAGLLAMPPYFFQYGQDDLREFFLQLAAQVGRGVPLYLHNVPFGPSQLAVDTATALLETGLFAGITDASGSLESCTRLLGLKANLPFSLFTGSDEIYAQARQAGVDGAVSATACAVPELMRALDRAACAGDTAAIARLNARLREFGAWTGRFPQPVAVRAAVECRGLKTGPPAVPLPPEKQRLMAEFREWFRGWLPAVQKESA